MAEQKEHEKHEDHGHKGHAEHSHQHRQKPDWKKISIIAGIAIVILLAIFLIPKLKSDKLAAGDKVNFEYTFKTGEGEVIGSDTSILTIGSAAQELGLVSNELDRQILAANNSKDILITLEPKDAFGEYDQSKIRVLNRTEKVERRQEINKTVVIDKSMFTSSFGTEPEKDRTYELEGSPWNYTVLQTGDTVEMLQNAEAGQFVPINTLFFANVSEVTSDKIILTYSAETKKEKIENGDLEVYSDSAYLYFKLTPEKGGKMTVGYSPARVLDFNETSIVVDYNSELAGKTITVEMKVLDIQKTKSSSQVFSGNKPLLQTFVMTHCPYGTQMEKGILPARELLGDKANFEIRFVSYTMHGDKEEQETKRQLCIREETSKFWEYLECFLDAGDDESCISKTGLSKTKINECIEKRADSYWEEDKALNTQYNVQGSPTTVLNGVEASIYPRSPQNVKNAVCAVFTDAPSECDRTISKENPSPGFGYSTSASSDAASSCG